MVKLCLQAAQLIAAYSADIATDWMQSAQQHPLPVSQTVQDISVYECNGVCCLLAQTENTSHWLEHFFGKNDVLDYHVIVKDDITIMPSKQTSFWTNQPSSKIS